MKYFVLILQLLWRFWFYLAGTIVVIIFFPAYFILLQRKEWFRYVFVLYKICARLILTLSGIFPKVERHFIPTNGQAYVICPNHISYLDIVTTYIAVPRYFHFIGKAELKNIPLFGYFFKEMNIPVDRASILSSHRAYKRACEDIDNGISVAIFPEATIPETAPQLKSFKNGAFKLAVEKQVPVIPVTYHNNHVIMPDGILRRMHAGRPGKSLITVHAPVETKGMTDGDIEKLKNQVYRILKESLETKRPPF